jgi:hydrogenase expression/formation protein HypC
VCLAVPGELISIDESLQSDGELPADALLRRMGKVSFGGIIKRVSLAYVPEAIIGDYVIVHVGFEYYRSIGSTANFGVFRAIAADCCGWSEISSLI